MKEDIRKTVLERKRRGKKNVNKPASKQTDLRTRVGDLRSVIAKKTKKKPPTPSKDLRETNKKLVSRKKPTTPPAPSTRKETRPTTRATRRTVAPGPGGQRLQQQPDQQYYVPPPIRRSQQVYSMNSHPMAPHPMETHRTSSVIANPPQHHQASASVLVSNLNPSITQPDVIELFGEIGVLTAVNMVNQNTALVTYQSSSDAFRAVRVYHSRLLDGRPMLVNMMPTAV